MTRSSESTDAVMVNTRFHPQLARWVMQSVSAKVDTFEPMVDKLTVVTDSSALQPKRETDDIKAELTENI